MTDRTDRACIGPDCNNEFEPQADNQRYCSKACAKRAEKARARERKRAEAKALATLPSSSHGSKLTSTERYDRLVALALNDGSPTRASRHLAAQGKDVSREALTSLKSTYSDEYLEVLDRLKSKVKAMHEAEHLSLAATNRDIEKKALAQLGDAIDSKELGPSQLSTVARNAAIDQGIHDDKAAMYRGEGTVVEHRTVDVASMFETIQRKWPGLLKPQTIDSTATEMPSSEAAPQEKP